MRVIFVGLQEYITIEKTIASKNHENMELLQRWKEIMKVQSTLIKEKKLLGCKVDSNILQKLCLEKRKLIFLPIVEVSVHSTSQPSSPQNPLTKSPCIIKRAKRSLLADFAKATSTPLKQLPQGEVPKPLLQGEVSDSDLLQALGKLDETK